MGGATAPVRARGVQAAARARARDLDRQPDHRRHRQDHADDASRASCLGTRLADRAWCAGVIDPGPGGHGDEERMYQLALGESVRDRGPGQVADGAARGPRAGLVLVDDGFSHWRLERDVDVVLLDASDPWGGGRMLPAGRLREPRRALQRAEAVVLTRLPAGGAPDGLVRGCSPRRAGRRAGGCASSRERLSRAGRRGCPRPTRVRVVTATGNPAAVVSERRSSRAAT